MKKLVLGVAAASALIVMAATPTMAQVGVYAGPGGFGVGVGPVGAGVGPGPYYGEPYYGYYDYARPGWYGPHHHRWHHRYYR